MSHDVCWSRYGPGAEHALAKRDLFTPDVIERILREGFNPFYNIPDIMDIEDRHGVRSTFFFRPVYDDAVSVWCYEDVIRDLVNGGWEIAVCLNNASSLDRIIKEKRMIERVSRSSVVGCRVHDLRIDVDDYWRLYLAGLRYDSSLKMFRDSINTSDMGFRWISNMLVFPVTIADVHMINYMDVTEDRISSVVRSAINEALRHNKSVITILWHDSSLKMIGGRMYGRVLEELASMDNIRLVRGLDLLRLIESGRL